MFCRGERHLVAAVDDSVARVVRLDDPEVSAQERADVTIEHHVELGVAEQRVAGRALRCDAAVTTGIKKKRHKWDQSSINRIMYVYITHS